MFDSQEAQLAAQSLPEKRENKEEGLESSTTRPLKTIELGLNPEPAVEEVDSDLDKMREIREVEILSLLDTQRFLRFDFKEWDEAEVEQFIKLFLIDPDHESLVLKLRKLRLNGAALHFICKGEAEELGLNENDTLILIPQLKAIERVVTENKLNIPPLFDYQEVQPAAQEEVDNDLDETREIREVEILSLLDTQRFLRSDIKEWDEAEVEQFIKLFLINPDHNSLVLKLRELQPNGAVLHCICEGEAEEFGLDENDRFVLIQQLDDIERIVTENKLNIPPLFD